MKITIHRRGVFFFISESEISLPLSRCVTAYEVSYIVFLEEFKVNQTSQKLFASKEPEYLLMCLVHPCFYI